MSFNKLEIHPADLEWINWNIHALIHLFKNPLFTKDCSVELSPGKRRLWVASNSGKEYHQWVNCPRFVSKYLNQNGVLMMQVLANSKVKLLLFLRGQRSPSWGGGVPRLPSLKGHLSLVPSYTTAGSWDYQKSPSRLSLPVPYYKFLCVLPFQRRTPAHIIIGMLQLRPQRCSRCPSN